MRQALTLPVLLLCAWLQPETLWAQSESTGGHIEIAVGVDRIGAVTFSTSDAIELDRDGEPFRLFRARGEMGSTVAYGLRFGVRITDVFEVETRASYASPDLIVRTDDDVESADPVEARETVHQIRVEGGLVANLRQPQASRRNIPFLIGGAGYSRELHEGQTLAVDGQEYFVGGGLKHTLRSRPGSRLEAVGMRLDARVIVRIKGIALDNRAHFLPVVGGSLFLRF